MARRIYAGTRTWIAGRSASLLAALERLQSEAIDIVLLGDEFRDEELALFVTGARRDGFAGLILCLASMQRHSAIILPLPRLPPASRPSKNSQGSATSHAQYARYAPAKRRMERFHFV